MKITMPKLYVGQKVRVTPEALAADDATAELLDGLTGVITSIDLRNELPIEVEFAECSELGAWGFVEGDLMEVNE